MSNREIKFRCWDKKEKKFLGIETISSMRNNKLTCFKGFWLDDNMVFQQSTELKDKNGKMIFDGDIVKVHKFTQELGENMGVIEGEKSFIAEIEFSMYGGIYIEAGGNNSGALWEYENGFHEDSFEIIGNVFENPEMFKEIK